MAQAYDTAVEEILGLTIERLRSLDATIDAHYEEYQRTGRKELFEDLCPYFGVPWPAGLALARYAEKRAQEWQKLSVLEIGCGLAIPSLVLARAGVQGVATDFHPDVPRFLEKNKRANGLDFPLFEFLDWRKQAVDVDVILASDFLYDREAVDAVLGFLGRSLWKEFVLVDPGRPYLGAFVQGLGAYQVEQKTEGNCTFVEVRRSS